MTKVFVAEGDNNMDYSDHYNWFICVANSVEAAEAKIRSEYSDYTFETEHPLLVDFGSFKYKWELYEKEDIEWTYNRIYYGRHTTVYIHLEEVAE